MHLVLLERFDCGVRHCRVLGYFVISYEEAGFCSFFSFSTCTASLSFSMLSEEQYRLWRVLKIGGKRGRACSARCPLVLGRQLSPLIV
jgi:hypothetical protein